MSTVEIDVERFDGLEQPPLPAAAGFDITAYGSISLFVLNRRVVAADRVERQRMLAERVFDADRLSCPASKSSIRWPTSSARQPLAKQRRLVRSSPRRIQADRRSGRGRRSPCRPGSSPRSRCGRCSTAPATRNCPSRLSCDGIASCDGRSMSSSGAFQPARDAVGNLVSISLLHAAVHAADGANPLDAVALALGQLDDQIVAQHAPRRHVAPLGLARAPHPQLAHDRQAARRQIAQARNPPPPRPVARILHLGQPALHFFAQPFEPVQSLELATAARRAAAAR